jgi:hypothetical protein
MLTHNWGTEYVVLENVFHKYSLWLYILNRHAQNHNFKYGCYSPTLLLTTTEFDAYHKDNLFYCLLKSALVIYAPLS